jgi:uncharacterized membrane protein YqiK
MYVIGVIAIVAIYAAKYKKVPPNMAMVVYGRRTRDPGMVGYQVITGGGKFIVPIIESYDLMPIDVRTWTIKWSDVVYDKTGEKGRSTLKATFLYKISSDESALKVAAEHLLGKTSEEIDEVARGTIEGTVRSLFADSTFSDLDQKWESTATKIQAYISQELMNVGLEVRSVTIHNLDRKD